MSRNIAVTIGCSALLLLAGCGNAESTGGTDAKPTSTCAGTTCTVTFPAKHRNNQGSEGGPGTTVFGVDAQLETIEQGQGLFKVGGGPLTLAEGATGKAGGLTVTVVTLAPESAVVKFTKD